MKLLKYTIPAAVILLLTSCRASYSCYCYVNNVSNNDTIYDAFLRYEIGITGYKKAKNLCDSYIEKLEKIYATVDTIDVDCSMGAAK